MFCLLLLFFTRNYAHVSPRLGNRIHFLKSSFKWKRNWFVHMKNHPCASFTIFFNTVMVQPPLSCILSNKRCAVESQMFPRMLKLLLLWGRSWKTSDSGKELLLCSSCCIWCSSELDAISSILSHQSQNHQEHSESECWADCRAVEEEVGKGEGEKQDAQKHHHLAGERAQPLAERWGPQFFFLTLRADADELVDSKNRWISFMCLKVSTTFGNLV